MNTVAPAPAMPVAAPASAAMPVEFVESSQPGMFYRVSPVACTCKAFQFGGGKACKHMRSAFPAPAPKVAPATRYCERPGCPDIARQASNFCSARCADLARNAEMDGFCAEAAAQLPDTDEATNAESARIAAEILSDVAAGRWAPVVVADLVADRARTAQLLAAGLNPFS